LAFGLRHAAWLSVKLGLVVGALLLVVLRSLWVRLEPPTGEPLARQEAPAFFARLDRLVARLHTPRVHRVLVTEDFNAAVMQLPARAVLAGGRRTGARHGATRLRALRRAQREPAAAFVRRGRPALAGAGAGGTDHLCRHTSFAQGAARSHEGGRTVRAALGRLGR